MFERCVFRGCTLVGSRWEGVALKDVIFQNCRLDYAIVNDVRTAGPVGFVGCSLTDVALNGGKLSPAAFDNCKLAGLAIEGCDLRGADLRGNDIRGLGAATVLRGAILSPSQLPALADLLAQEISIKVGPEPN